jgi:uncharacterized protein YegL
MNNQTKVYDENNLPFADNPDARCPVVLLADTSWSMSANNRINKLNEGIKRFFEDINSNTLTKRRIDLAIITVGDSSPQLVQPMVTVQDILGDTLLPPFIASGGTPMDEALRMALSEIEARKAVLRENGIEYYKPLIFCLSDGEFYVASETVKNLHKSEERNGHSLFAVGVGSDASPDSLTSISAKGRAFFLQDTDFSDLFEFMSSSLGSVANSAPGDALTIALPDSMTIVQNKSVDL